MIYFPSTLEVKRFLSQYLLIIHECHVNKWRSTKGLLMTFTQKWSNVQVTSNWKSYHPGQPPTNPPLPPPVREWEVNPSQGQHNSVPLLFINTLGWRETAWSEVTCPRTQGAFTYYSGQASILSYWKLQTLHLKGQNLPPSVVMSQYTLTGCPVPFGSIQYSPFFCAFVYFQMSLQETPGKSGDKPFLTDRREEM